MALMRPRWTRDRWPQAYVCTRCGRPVPGYERMWLAREKVKEKEQQG
jgi:ribosomal protein S14